MSYHESIFYVKVIIFPKLILHFLKNFADKMTKNWKLKHQLQNSPPPLKATKSLKIYTHVGYLGNKNYVGFLQI